MPTRSQPDAIADCVLNAFKRLPQKYKPRTLADGRREWVPLAGIVLSRGMSTLEVGGRSAREADLGRIRSCVERCTRQGKGREGAG